MSTRRRTLAVVVAALIAGLCFGPVFGVAPLLLPVGVICLVAYGVTELCRYWQGLLPWRPLLMAFGGLLALIETVLQATTMAGLPTLESVRALGRGLNSWQLTLESTWPARPDSELLLFVPLLVLLACLLGIELLDRAPVLVAVIPALVVVGVSQTYIALTGATAVLVALGFAAVVAALLVPDLVSPDRVRRTSPVTPLIAAAVVTVVAVIGGFVVSAIDPVGRDPYTLQRVQSATAPGARPTSPLDELAGRLQGPDKDAVVFRYQSSDPVGRWRQVALDDFDGANWTTSHPVLRLGSQLTPDSDVTVPVSPQRASVRLDGLRGPWLPGQLLPSGVQGAVEPQVEPIGSTLLAEEPPGQYELTWSKPTVDAQYLLHAGVDAEAPGGLGDLGSAPSEVTELAVSALADRRATFATALALEAYLRKNYNLAVQEPLPTGHSWPQLRRFLFDGVPGTSEQFAAAYVAMARINGIPARLVVGFRAPAQPDADGWYTVRNRDALAWPEVAVAGVGWWPLDPAGQAATGKTAVPGSDTDVTDQARKEVPPVEDLEDPEVAPAPADRAGGSTWDGVGVPVLWMFVASSLVLLLWLFGVPLLKFVRALRRRRRTGSAAVVGAWAEARDRLRAHGVAVTSGMTVRDLALASSDVTDARAQAGLGLVARSVDHALWSGAPVSDEVGRQAWAGVREVRRGLRSRPWTDRLQAALELRSLF
ncbi:transglutaminase superfamily protein [Kribbella sp. VKM Ac-2527]|uniref:Transglutaminase superfamily protein n=1 Tax=Kribbella caucasensis TaxID=2512215 RepID=A0A4V3CAH4_9ACTN|nr:transglutaminase domain-containing protein [Kribbella sp. VKM Ac-2527]TDO50638.1 transglutaminase superfamily protein [Kribbella sp. VKM Ac-2527]